ncbi:MAG: ATP-binding cassette domain-containing protein [Halieaceae bacterium]|jgi:ABC-2 type transport system ATP-binding protein|nr:ATP-binding cassette domain-containing protein [Halieaceae bacterium]
MSVEIVITDLVKRFGDIPALDGVTARIRGGQLTGVVGPDGAGKTTLMRCLAALMLPSEGTITVCGHDVVTRAGTIHEITGYMPQRFGLYEDLSVMQNLHLHAELRGLDTGSGGELFDRLLTFTGLAPFTKRLAGALSGGMKQKLGLACALMSRPRVLLLDEPSVGVDPVSRQDLWRMVQELVAEGMAVVWSTAYLDEAQSCQEVLLLNHGRIVYAGAPGDLTSRLEGRSYLMRDISGNRRLALQQGLQLPGVRDGVIQGASVRLVLAEGAGRQAVETLAGAYSAQLVPTPPRFEDAFIDLLGGGPDGVSSIAAQMAPIPPREGVMVRCQSLTKQFGDFTATRDISFDVRQGEILGLLGPNGAGKSTTFKMLCGLIKPTSGLAEVVGLDLRYSSSAAKQQLGYMAQKFSLYGLLSVRQNLDFFAGVYGLKRTLRKERVREMIDLFELTPMLDDSPDELPLGFKQRLALACALMHRPKVLFLDEPTSGVDPITRREFWTHITGLVGKGVTVLVTTHFMEEAEYCDRVALVNRGQLIALDTPDMLKASVADEALPDPTMEQAFIRLIERRNALEDDRERAA